MQPGKEKSILAASFLLGCAVACSASAQNQLDLEVGRVFPGYNDVAIPGDTGTRLSLTDDLEADEATAFRLRYSHTFSRRHWVAVLVAPLTAESSGILDGSVDFNGTTFGEGTPVDATFRFDSYRLIYRYLVHQSDQWQCSFGGAAKIRDAAIRLRSADRSSEKRNTGFVPLLSFNLTWTPIERLHLLLDGEAMAAPQGRAEDLLFAAQYDVNPQLALRVGYRILEGGADNDEVYTFSLFHSIVAGATWSF